MKDRIRQITDIFAMNRIRTGPIPVEEKYLETEQAYCPCCRKEYGVRKITGIVQRDPDVNWVECETCKAWSASRMPRKECLAEAYLLAHQLHHEDESFNDYLRLARHIIRLAGLEKGSLPPREYFDILDFGGGNGGLLSAMKKEIPDQGYTYTVVDVSNAGQPTNRNGIKLLDHLPENGKQYQLVIASAVLEHIPDVYNTLTQLYSSLPEGGILYIRTPWHGPIKQIFAGIDLGYPGHVHDMGQAFWEKIWNVLEFKVYILYSAPSINQTGYRYDFFRTLVVDVLKMPGNVHNKFRSFGKPTLWPYVGGWEILVQKTSA